MSIPIIILNWNGLDDTLECIEALAQQSEGDWSVRLYDNGSDGNEARVLERRLAGEPRVTLRRFPENYGFAGGMNRALGEVLEESDHPCVILLNNDTIPEPGWLAALIAAAEGADCVASRLVRDDDPGVIDNAGHYMLNTGEIMPRGTGEPAHHYERPATLIGACAGAALYRVAMLREIGLFDPFFGSGYEDAELGLRAYLAGYEIRYAPAAVVRHKVSRSVDKIRTEAYAIKIQRDIFYTYLKLVPAAVIALNLPFLLVRLIGVPLVALLVGRWTLARVQLVALAAGLRDAGTAWRARRQARALRRRRATDLLRLQHFFLPIYWRYFKRYVVAGRTTVFERRRPAE